MGPRVAKEDLLIFSLHGARTLVDQGLLNIELQNYTNLYTPHSEGLLLTRDQPEAGKST